MPVVVAAAPLVPPAAAALGKALAWTAAAVGLGYGAAKGGEYLGNKMAEANEGADEELSEAPPIVCQGECPPPKADDPGQPTEEDGFKPPKRGTRGKVLNPNGSGKGWKDANGEVWVPTGHGPTAHGGPHWDVQNPRTGRHRNVYPGGRVR